MPSSARVFENAHDGFKEFKDIRIFTPYMYLFKDEEFMFQRIYNFVIIVVKAISTSEYDLLELYINKIIKNEKDREHFKKVIREHTSYFVRISDYQSSNGTTIYVRFLLSSIYPFFYCKEIQDGSRELTNYIFGDQIPGGASNMVSVVDLNEAFENVMCSDGCIVKENNEVDILHFRSTFKSYELESEAGAEHWLKFRF